MPYLNECRQSTLTLLLVGLSEESWRVVLGVKPTKMGHRGRAGSCSQNVLKTEGCLIT